MKFFILMAILVAQIAQAQDNYQEVATFSQKSIGVSKFSPDGKTLAVGEARIGDSDRSVVHIIDLATYSVKYKFENNGQIRNLIFTNDSSRLIYTTGLGKVRVIDLNTGDINFEIGKYDLSIDSASLTEDEKNLILKAEVVRNNKLTGEMILEAVDLISGKTLLSRRYLPNAPLHSISPSGLLYAVRKDDHTFDIHNTFSGKLTRTVSFSKSGILWNSAFSPDDSFFVFSDETTVHVISLAKSQKSIELPTPGRVVSFSFDPHRKLIAFATTYGNTLEAYDLYSGKKTLEFNFYQAFKSGYPMIAQFSGNGKFLYGGSSQGIAVYDLSAKELLYIKYCDGRQLIACDFSMSISPDGKHLAAEFNYGEMSLLRTVQ